MILSPETFARIQAAYKETSLKGVAGITHESLVEAENTPLDVAVFGESGTGKYAFINDLWGHSYEVKGFASVAAVETSKKTTANHANIQNIPVWSSGTRLELEPSSSFHIHI